MGFGKTKEEDDDDDDNEDEDDEEEEGEEKKEESGNRTRFSCRVWWCEKQRDGLYPNGNIYIKTKLGD